MLSPRQQAGRVPAGLLQRIAIVAAAAVLVPIAAIQPVAATSVGAPRAVPANGRIAFMRWDLAIDDQVVYTVNPDGTHEQRLLPGQAEFPRWSPDGREIAVLCCDAAAKIVTVDTGATRTLPWPAGLVLGCSVWSADGARLLCEGFGETDVALNGIYSIRATDGGDLRRLTVNPDGDDIPVDVSPDGTRIAFVSDRDGGGLFVMSSDGSAIHRLDTGALFDIPSASWSPLRDQLLFAARKGPGQRRSLFVIDSDGSHLQEIPLDPACGGLAADARSRGCLDPAWSPDGTQIVLDVLPAANGQKQIYTLDADGSHLSKITHHGFVFGGEGEQGPDWGTHPLG